MGSNGNIGSSGNMGSNENIGGSLLVNVPNRESYETANREKLDSQSILIQLKDEVLPGKRDGRVHEL